MRSITDADVHAYLASLDGSEAASVEGLVAFIQRRDALQPPAPAPSPLERIANALLRPFQLHRKDRP